MAVYRCPNCLIPCMEAEVEQGICPGCKTPLGTAGGLARQEGPVPAATAGAVPRRGLPFVLGLCVGGVLGVASAWALWQSDSPPPVKERPPSQAAASTPKETQSAKRKTDAPREAAESARAEALKERDRAKQKAEAALKQKKDAEQRLQEALARLEHEGKRRTDLEKAIADLKKPRPAPTQSFVRDWQLLGPFAGTGVQAHDMVYPPEHEPFQLAKSYEGFGGRVKWRPYRSHEDKIDLARFFQYWSAGAAYAVTWVYSENDRDVILSVGSDDGIRLWVNGVKTHDVKGGRQARPGQDLVRAHLKKGWNEVRVKVDNIVGTWELYLEFRTADGRQPLKMLSTSSPPAMPG